MLPKIMVAKKYIHANYEVARMQSNIIKLQLSPLRI